MFLSRNAKYEEFDSKVKYPFQLIFVKDDRKFETSCRLLEIEVLLEVIIK